VWLTMHVHSLLPRGKFPICNAWLRQTVVTNAATTDKKWLTHA
jgi:hypothetical protein